MFTFVLLINRIFKLTELIVNKGVPAWQVLNLIWCILPSFLTLTIPMAVLLSTLVAFGRLSTDSEVTAMKATGFSLYRLMAPVFAASVVAAAVTACFSLYLGPAKARDFRKDVFILAKSKAFMNVEDGVFNDSIKDVVIYARKTPSLNEMEGVFISDERDQSDPYVIIAKRGVLDIDASSGYAYLNLYGGSIHKKENKTGTYREIDFDKNTLSISLYDKLLFGDSGKKSKREMTLRELAAAARAAAAAGNNENPLMTEYYKRFTVPLACLVFAMIGPPLGLFSRRSGRSAGVSVALAVFAFYYLVMKGGENMAAAGYVPPVLAAFLPILLTGAFGAYVMVNAGRDNAYSPRALMGMARRNWRLARRRK